MKTQKKIILIAAMLLSAIFVLPLIAFADGEPGCPDCPIDSGLSSLIAAGIGYGVKKYRSGRKTVMTK